MNNPRAAIATTIIAFLAALALPMLDVLVYRAAAETVTTLRFFSHDTQQTSLDLGPSGPGPGDQLIFSGDVFTEPGGMRLGRLAGQVTTLSGDLTAGEVLFASTFVLDGGQIAIQGLADSAALLGRGETLPVLILGRHRNLYGCQRRWHHPGAKSNRCELRSECGQNLILTLLYNAGVRGD